MDLIEALEAADIDWHKGRDKDEIYICCPFCNDQRFRLGVNVVSGYAHCFNDGCEWGSKNVDYTWRKLQEAFDTGEIESKQRKRKRRKKLEQIELPEGYRPLKHPSEDNYHWNKVAWRYLRDRGISADQIIEKKIGFTVERPDDKDKPDYAYRAIFPVWLSGKLVGFTGRDFTGKLDPPWKNSVGSKCIFNLPEKKHSTCVLSEAAVPALVIERVSKKMGIDSLGLLGHSLKDDQISLLHHYRRVICWLDPDTAGVEGLEQIYAKLKNEKKSLRVVLPKRMLDGDDFDARDPDELSRLLILMFTFILSNSACMISSLRSAIQTNTFSLSGYVLEMVSLSICSDFFPVNVLTRTPRPLLMFRVFPFMNFLQNGKRLSRMNLRLTLYFISHARNVRRRNWSLSLIYNFIWR